MFSNQKLDNLICNYRSDLYLSNIVKFIEVVKERVKNLEINMDKFVIYINHEEFRKALEQNKPQI